jgi:hypothetical protein
MDRLLRGFIVTLFGVGTTLLTAVALVYLELRYDCAFYGYVYAFVIPIGAITSGFVAASGYFAGSRLLSYRPGRGMLVTMLGVSGGNFFLVYWLEYMLLKVDGISIRSFMSYSAYLRFTLTHTVITMDPGQYSGDQFTLGMGGYLYAAVLILGFALGGFLVFGLMRLAPYCEACSLYMKKYGSQTRYFVRQEEMTAAAAAFQAEMGRGQFRRAMEIHSEAGMRGMDASTGYSLCAEVRQCKECRNQWIQLIEKQRVNKAWNKIPEFRYSAYCTERVDGLEQLAGSS